MRFRALTLATTVATLALPLSGTSSARASCLAFALPPHITKNAAISGTGGFACESAAYGMSVTVCIDEQIGGIASTAWYTLGCTTSPLLSEQTQVVTASALVTNVPVYSTFLRTTATATNADNQDGYAESAPYLWVNCACMP